ncbi:hypothetical protein DSO57_1024823 [Entomophthora muscae]|uniref:Uncharacterized protein n=2 Tax=Entomophthora muscae TaxID=34485 RepID=A0ACC2RW17_9FUNG|nr:hypothetical protein DSO57_1016567 [Entomophthora muscae]KAJ9072680.1 hypothetical protein DSO57_1024823 [Entomophthora muscae]
MRTSLITLAALSSVYGNLFFIPFLGNDQVPTPEVPTKAHDAIPHANDKGLSDDYFNQFKKFITESAASVEHAIDPKSDSGVDSHTVEHLVNDLLFKKDHMLDQKVPTSALPDSMDKEDESDD